MAWSDAARAAALAARRAHSHKMGTKVQRTKMVSLVKRYREHMRGAGSTASMGAFRAHIAGATTTHHAYRRLKQSLGGRAFKGYFRKSGI